MADWRLKRLAAKKKLVDDMRTEVRIRQDKLNRTRKEVDRYLLHAAKAELRKAEKKYERYRRKLARKGLV